MYWHALHLNACCHGGPVNHLLLGRTSPKGLLLQLVLCQTTPLPLSRSRHRFCARRHHCRIPGAETGSVSDHTTATLQEQRQVLCQTTPLPHSRSRQVMCQTLPLPHSRSRDRFCVKWHHCHIPGADRFCARPHHCHIPGAETGSVPYHTIATFQEQRQRKYRWALSEGPGNTAGCLTAWGNGKDGFASEEQCWFTSGDTCACALMSQWTSGLLTLAKEGQYFLCLSTLHALLRLSPPTEHFLTSA